MESVKVMSLGFVSYKIPDGKLVKIKLEVKEDRIHAVTILGDFFLHPEETLEAIEQGLLGVRLDEVEVSSAIQDVLDSHKAVMIGASAIHLARAIMVAHESY